MKRVAVLLAIVVFSSIAANAAADAPAKPNMFPTMAACEAALKSGNFRYYVPKFYSNHSREPVNGIDRVIVPLEADSCLEMQVAVRGRWFVVQKEGTLFRGRKLPDGSIALYARDDCGNRVQGVMFPAPALPVAEVEPERPAAIYVPPPRPPVEDDFVPPPVYVEKKGRKKWPWVVGALAGGAAYAAYYYWPCPDGTKRR